jgi:hypothetical protein
MSAPATHQSPVILQRQHSTRHPHQRQHSTTRSTAPPSREGDHGLNQLPSRDQATSRVANPADATSHRSAHSRQSSQMSSAATPAGPSSHAPQPVVVENDPSRQHQMQRPRKTSIHGSSGTWNLGKTIGAGSMGKVKLARKSDNSEQVTLILLSMRACELIVHRCRSLSK